MAEQTFRSPGFFEQEIDLSSTTSTITGTPAGVIGTAERGPAFVPVTIGSFTDFQLKFGSLDSNRFGPYAVKEFLENRDALTYLRVLGAGANTTSGDIDVIILGCLGFLTTKPRQSGFLSWFSYHQYSLS